MGHDRFISISSFYLSASLLFIIHHEGPIKIKDGKGTSAFYFKGPLVNQGVNLLCREGNSQPGHWMLIPERRQERRRKRKNRGENPKGKKEIWESREMS